MREVIRGLRRKYPPDTVAVTASTGIAACNVGGRTLHAFGGFVPGPETAEEAARKIKGKTSQRWKKTKALIIDESELRVGDREDADCTTTVSMVDGDLFDKVVGIARVLRKKDEGMGGIQVRGALYARLSVLTRESSSSREISFRCAGRPGARRESLTTAVSSRP